MNKEHHGNDLRMRVEVPAARRSLRVGLSSDCDCELYSGRGSGCPRNQLRL